MLYWSVPSSSSGRNHFLYDLSTSAPARPIFESDHASTTLVYQLGEGRFLGHDHRSVFVLDGTTGETTPLLADGRTSLLAVSADRIFFLSHEGEVPLGYDLSGPTVRYERSSDRLHVGRLPAVDRARPLFDRPVEAVLGLHEDRFLVITAGQQRELWRVPADGNQAQRLAAIDPHWIAPEMHAKLSPDGRYVALAAPHDEHSFHDERELAVVDMKTQRVVFRESRLPTDSMARDSTVAQLSFGWHDHKTVFVNELFKQVIHLDVQTGARTNRPTGTPEVESQAPASGRIHFWADIEEMQTRSRYSGKVPRRYGCFDLSWGKASYASTKAPACDVTDGSDTWTGAMSVSDDGQWAACATTASGTILVDGPKRSTSVLFDGMPTELRWLAHPEWIASLPSAAAPTKCAP